jgi:hypothetical protein
VSNSGLKSKGISYLKKIAAYYYAREKSGIAGPLYRAAKVVDALVYLSTDSGSRKAGDRTLALKARANSIQEVLDVTAKLRRSSNLKNRRIGHYLELATYNAMF